MELKNYFEILWRRKWIIILAAGLALLAAAGGTRMIKPTYDTAVKVRLDPSSELLDTAGVVYIDRLMKTKIQEVSSDSYRAKVEQQLGFILPRTLKASAEVVPDTNVLEIQVEDRDPMMAAQVANILATILVEENKVSKMGRLAPLTILDTAEIPTSPSKPVLRMNMILGLLAGLVVGVGLSFLFEHLDTRLYTMRQIQEVTELPTLAQIPLAKKNRTTFQNGQSFQGEVYRQLRTRIFALELDPPLKTLMITSAEPNEGKSTVAANLAFAMAQSGQRVVVVDGDLRRPTLHKLFGLPNEAGLSTILTSQTTLDEALQVAQVGIPGEKVSVLTSGPVPPHPAELLGSSQTTSLIAQLTERFDMVLLDTPCFIAVTDAAVLARVVDGVMLVVGYAQARHEHVQTVRRHLAEMKAHIIGVVVNRVDQSNSPFYYYQHK